MDDLFDVYTRGGHHITLKSVKTVNGEDMLVPIKKNVEIDAIIFAFVLYLKIKISLTNKKNTIIVNPNIITGNNAPANSILKLPNKLTASYVP